MERPEKLRFSLGMEEFGDEELKSAVIEQEVQLSRELFSRVFSDRQGRRE
jgi:hypothetical protein